MTFWSSQRLEANLGRLNDHPDSEMVDCNALTLRVGPEVYVTPGLEQASPSTHTRQMLGPRGPVTVSPGQFAFLLTEEKITIPPEVMGFISTKATYKLRGLVNVSGFHVDPGWSGRLIFTVFNAGPATIHLERGLKVFLLWIADLDEASAKRKHETGPEGIPPGVINNITGVVDSIYALERRVKSEIKDVADKQQAFRDEVAGLRERQNKLLLYFAIAAVFAGALVGVGTKIIADKVFPAPVFPAAAAQGVAQPPAVTAAPPRRPPGLSAAEAKAHP